LERYKEDYAPFGFYKDGKLVGFASITNKGNGVHAVNNLAVLPKHRHEGIGKTLLDFCKARARDHGGVKIEIELIGENTVLKNWYLANGFMCTRVQALPRLTFTVAYMEWNIL
jgi:ribosomal protein S18 acetylase RimI-like enzyme